MTRGRHGPTPAVCRPRLRGVRWRTTRAGFDIRSQRRVISAPRPKEGHEKHQTITVLANATSADPRHKTEPAVCAHPNPC